MTPELLDDVRKIMKQLFQLLGKDSCYILTRNNKFLLFIRVEKNPCHVVKFHLRSFETLLIPLWLRDFWLIHFKATSVRFLTYCHDNFHLLGFWIWHFRSVNSNREGNFLMAFFLWSFVLICSSLLASVRMNTTWVDHSTPIKYQDNVTNLASQ